MICNYQNINDYCLNQYSYQFIGTISNNGVVSIDKSETAPVLRTDKTTGENKVISQFSSNIIKPCSSTDDNESTTEWECYIIYRYIGSGYISDPPLDTLKNAQIDIINNSYDSSLDEGILVNINNTNVILGSTIEDQIYYQSILNYSQALYDDDSDAVMPSFSDSQNKVYSVSYNTLVSIFKTYFNKVIYYKNLKESLVSQCLNCNTLSDIETLNWCDTKVLISNIQSTKIVTNVEKTSVQNCEDIAISGPLCDPPCDPDSCESCVNGECVSYCSEGECCINGECTINSSCYYCYHETGAPDAATCYSLYSVPGLEFLFCPPSPESPPGSYGDCHMWVLGDASLTTQQDRDNYCTYDSGIPSIPTSGNCNTGSCVFDVSNLC